MITNIIRYHTLVTESLSDVLSMLSNFIYLCLNFINEVIYLDHCSDLTLLLRQSLIDDLVFSVFTSNFFKLSHKISLIKNRFVTLFFIRFS